MNSIKILLFFALFPFFINAQSTNQKPALQTNKDEMVFKNAASLGDLETATIALHSLVVSSPNGLAYRDTLALVYLERGLFVQAQLLTKILFQEKPNQMRAEILAICSKKLGNPTDAIDYYRYLYTSTQNNNYAFEMLQLEYQVKRLAEAKFTAEKLLNTLPLNDSTELVTLKGDNSTNQKIALKSGVYYILGNINRDLNLLDAAILAYQSALKINPDYDNAALALEAINSSKDVKKK